GAEVTARDRARFREPLRERRDVFQFSRITLDRAHEHADAAHAIRLLPARRNRPSGYTAAEKCDEVPPPHGAYPKAKDHGSSIKDSRSGRCIAAKATGSCPLWVVCHEHRHESR